MNIAFYSAAAGMISQSNGLNIYANNIANVNTVGFKAERPNFKDCIYTIQRATEEDWQTGHGQYIAKTDLMWERGSFVASEQDLDFALPEDGFFKVLDDRGNSYLTRDGSFTVTNMGDHWELVNGSGEFVLDYEGNHITVPFVTEEDGTVTDTIDYEKVTDMIGVYTVPNNWGLEQASDNHFVVTARSGLDTPDTSADKVRNALEMSTVDIASDMVHIIETQRSYQLNAKLVQTADEFANIANNLR